MNAKRCFSLVTVLAVAMLAALQTVPVHAADGTHTVQAGDTLSGIAGRYGVSMAAIRSANNLYNTDQIQVGMVLVIPRGTSASSQPSGLNAGSVNGGKASTQIGSGYSAGFGRPAGGCSNPYIVQAGDSLSVIAARCGVTLAALAAANGLGSAGTIYAGQSLVISNAANGDAADSYSGRATPVSPGGRSACTNPYLVRLGDTLNLVAARCGVTVENLRRWNNLRTDIIWPGLRLMTQEPPAGTSAPLPTSVPMPTSRPMPTSTPSVRLPLAAFVPSNPATPTPRIEPTISPW